MEHSIAFENVSKQYPVYSGVKSGIKSFVLNLPQSIKDLNVQQFKALDNLSFYVNRGEAFGIMGHNGAGKSTTLELIAGVIKPTSGNVWVKGRIAPLLQLGAGFHDDLTGMENILLNGMLLGLRKKEVKLNIEKIKEFADIGEFVNQPIRTYSTGMRARLGFAIAIHTNPDILLVDELLSVGDSDFQQKCIVKMNEFKRNGVTIVLVSHEKRIMESFCDRIIHIEHGQLVNH